MSAALIARPQAFRVSVEPSQIEDLRSRLARTRWPDQLPDAGWDYGVELGALQSLCRYWEREFDWRGYESRFNAHPQFTSAFEGQHLHFYHRRSPEPDAKPLLLVHGWPGSVVEFHDVIGPLADPRAHGGDPRNAFHVVVPSLPGYGYSGPTTRRGYGADDIAKAFDAIMRSLGYARYFVQGGDWGSLIGTLLGANYASQVEALHLNVASAPPPDPADPRAGLDAGALADTEHNARIFKTEMAYRELQSTKPSSLAVGLMDSPAGMAGWLLEKFHGWSDCQGDPLNAFTYDKLLDNISLYWLTGTIASSMRLYFEDAHPDRRRTQLPSVSVPTGMARFPAEFLRFPRAWIERKYKVVHWREMPRGGHFAAMEQPQAFVEDLRLFFSRFR